MTNLQLIERHRDLVADAISATKAAFTTGNTAEMLRVVDELTAIEVEMLARMDQRPSIN